MQSASKVKLKVVKSWPKINIGDLVYIKWEDHYHNYTAGWMDARMREAAAEGFSPVYCETAGFCVHNSPDKIGLAPSWCDEDTNGGIAVKLKKTIVEVKVYRKRKVQ